LHLQCPAELRRLADQIASAPGSAGGTHGGGGCKAFLDIGGDRESGAVVRMIFAVVDAIAPRLIVVKSLNLFAALVPHVPHPPAAPAAVGPANAAWLAAMRALAAPGPDAPLPTREPARINRQARRAARRAASASECAGEGGGDSDETGRARDTALDASPDGAPRPALPGPVTPAVWG
jgi:hypothetical protein